MTDLLNGEGATPAPKRATLDGCSGFGQLCSRRDYLAGAIAPSALDLLTRKDDYVPPEFPVALPSVEDAGRTPFGKEMKKKFFHLDDDWGTFLNHGAFGASLKPALDFAQAFQRYIDQQPLRFFDREMIPIMIDATRKIAEFLDIDPTDIVLIDNVTTAVNTVIKNINWSPGDKIFLLSTTYGAVKKLINYICDTTGAVLEEIQVTFPIVDKKQLIDYVSANLEAGTKLAIFDHIPSNTPFIMPLQEIIDICHERGVPVMVDGAHTIPNIPLNLTRLNPDYYIANCHKWLCCPKGCAILYVKKELQDSTRSLILSHGTGQGFNREFIWTGLKDYTSFFALHPVIDFWEAVGVERAREYMHGLAIKAAKLLTSKWNTEMFAPEDMIASMVCVELPEDLYQNCGAVEATTSQVVQDLLYYRYKIEVPMKAVQGILYVRISCHLHNVLDDYEKLADAVLDLTENRTLEKILKIKKTMAEVKMSQAQLPNKFPSISPRKPIHEATHTRRTNRSQRTNNSDGDDMTPSIHGRPGTPTSVMQHAPGVELPKLIHLNPLMDTDQRKPFGRAATTMTGVPKGYFNECLSIVPPPTLSPLPSHRHDGGFKPNQKTSSAKMQNMQGGMNIPLDDDNQVDYDLPYQGSYFKSSTVMRMYTIPRRHPEMFGSRDSLYYHKKKGVILHTDRYRWEEKNRVEKPVDEKSQRDRLEAEMEHIEKVKGMKRRLDSALPHRMQHDLLMGGKKMEFTERVDISGELSRLRAMVLPTDAKDLYLGRGIGTRLPKFHQINKPRGPPVPEPPASLSAPAILDRGNKLSLHSSRQPLPNLPSEQSLDRMFKRECTCIPLPTIPAQARVRKRQRRSVDDSNIKYGETQRKPPVPKLSDISTDIELLGSPTGVPKPNPTLTVNNIKFVSPARMEEAGSEVKPSWGKEDVDKTPIPGPPPTSDCSSMDTIDQFLNPWEDDAESDMEIDLPAEGGGATPRPPDKGAVTPRAEVSSSPMKAVTPNPLKFVDAGIAEEERDVLRETFKRLDTDADGHILYQQIKTQLPGTMTSAQEKYIKQVYDITSASTYFGVEEFYTMTALINKFKGLSGPVLEAFEKVDMTRIKERIVQYVELFQTVDRSGKGGISMESVEEIICQAMEKDKENDKNFLKQIFEVLKPDEEDNVNKLEFILHIPYFRSLEKPDTGSTRKST
ncbi:uncharacterized protein LOC135487744 [Lineus longissimus]|uniref:uncharacterized protein LOC135487744 n=1 Tax=Lineus longissimus TaxID=88925 RepID=UPI00315C5B25